MAKITDMSDEQLNDLASCLREKLKLRAKNEDLTNHLWAVVRAVGRLLDDKYTEGDEAVRKGLWTALHRTADEAREYLTPSPVK